MMNAAHEGPLRMRGQREGHLEEQVVQPLAGARLCLGLRDLVAYDMPSPAAKVVARYAFHGNVTQRATATALSCSPKCFAT